MNNPKPTPDEVALFRFGVIGDLVHLPLGARGIYDKIRDKAEQDYDIPGTTRRRVAAETIRHWLKLYRKGSFDALKPKVRADHGSSRALPQEVVDQLCKIKEDNSALSVQLVIKHLRDAGGVPDELPLPLSTVHRLLARRGLMTKRSEESGQDRRRFAYEKAGELWMSDVMHGPAVVVGKKVKRKTYLIAFVDDATRVVPYAAFALSENTQAFLPIFKQALLRRGLPQRLFVDNGANYRSRHLALVCAKLGVALIHARAYQPQSKGKIERYFRTVRLQLLPQLRTDDVQSLEALNRRLWAWVEGEYHNAPHRGLGNETPLDRWARVADDVRYPEPGVDLDDLFLFESKRKVQRDRTVSLHGVAYEVEAVLVGETVTLRYDPSAKPGRPVQVWHEGRPYREAKVVDAYANCFVRRNRPSGNLAAEHPPATAPESLSLSKLGHDEEG